MKAELKDIVDELEEFVSLKDKDIDIILFTDPRSYNLGINFGSFEILNYLRYLIKIRKKFIHFFNPIYFNTIQQIRWSHLSSKFIYIRKIYSGT